MTRRQNRSGRPAPAGNGPLPELGRQFTRQRARAQRAWRVYLATNGMTDPTASAKAHQAWSNAVDETVLTVEAISVESVHDLDDLLIQHEAIWWWVGEDDNVLDGSTRRWLGRFGRHLRRFVRLSR